jgi:predicted RNase H-like HicB family nuclease
MQYYVIYETGADGGWGAYAPDLPGLGVSGSSLAEVRTLIREGIEFHIRGLREDGLPIPEPSALSGELIEVPAA